MPSSVRVDVEELKSQWSKELGLPQHKVKIYSKPTLGIVADLFASSAALAWLLVQLGEEVRKAIERAPTSVKGAYLRGILATEGTVNLTKYAVRIEMKDEQEMTFIHKIFCELGITCSKHFYQARERWIISIFGRANLEKLLRNGGFGLYQKKNVLLGELLSSYKELQLPSKVRYLQVHTEIQKQGVVTINHIMKSLVISHERARQLLYHLVKRGDLSVDKSERPYIFRLKTCQPSTSVSMTQIPKLECVRLTSGQSSLKNLSRSGQS